jgi:hypothetical protein
MEERACSEDEISALRLESWMEALPGLPQDFGDNGLVRVSCAAGCCRSRSRAWPIEDDDQSIGKWR